MVRMITYYIYIHTIDRSITGSVGGGFLFSWMQKEMEY
jgi:hypothetical protein